MKGIAKSLALPLAHTTDCTSNFGLSYRSAPLGSLFILLLLLLLLSLMPLLLLLLLIALHTREKRN